MDQRQCAVAECSTAALHRGWCKKHYSRWQRHGDPELVVKPRGTPEERFWAKVDKTGRCWLWTAGLANGGYGAFNVRRGETVKAHRFAFEMLVGPIPDGRQIDHLCRVRRCVNPAHLEVVTQAENIVRGESGQHYGERTHCTAGHQFDDANTIRRPNGGRACRKCGNERMRAYRARKALARLGPG